MPENCTNLASLARKYKGAPLAIIWVLIFTKQCVSQHYLQSLTGYTDKTIAGALKYLVEDGMISQHFNGYILTREIQLPLELPDTVCQTVGEIPTSLVLDINTDTNSIDLNINTTTGRKNSDTWFELERAGVYRNKTTEQLADKVTADQVRQVVIDLTTAGKPMPSNAGLLIKRLMTQPKHIDRKHNDRNRYADWEK